MGTGVKCVSSIVGAFLLLLHVCTVNHHTCLHTCVCVCICLSRELVLVLGLCVCVTEFKRLCVCVCV